MDERKTAVVTGAASGLGRDIAIALGRKGSRVLVADLDMKEAAITSTMVEQAGGAGEVYRCDVTRVEEVQAMADHVFAAWGGLDLLVNNAGVAAAGVVGNMPIEDWHWLMNINLWGMVYGCHAFIPRMKQSQRGHIINVASLAGIVSLPEMACYNVSKAAVISLSETLRGELAPFGIGVSVVCPSFFNTNLLRDMRYCDEFQCTFAHAAFDNARMTSEDVAGLVLKAWEKNRLYVLPQASAKMQWFFKRLSPANYYENFARLNKSDMFRRFVLVMARLGLT
ncbi:MAG TPA: SDR family NAD(P)-dependent oxidoreductase [Deltaproteobacteria bacterium]|jgi:NAD(P)-dependent dehydrogenase (short-subunit alcohol dehydrogenase family)|nr:MAG: putative oxidoreductase SadH [Deltaproteobacteria bacterium ADurb.Bin072]HNQ86760.1 SDR family NAD(P)-dependent oxidoreductase [Deltaproteobacteria bacterium]HNS89313.1 SDR family NAD(P)-dependent oxidoreductase [Deltaproteobacteria bacterium]HOA44890.1 SDR family NAD(P)-dependent oxidoreductase [Deltaproteobacteria bacterium]HOG85492.1 SDR family NAD(P)-dependent oxidoreductase [Deltaproteobacteria bacterium]